MIDLSVDLALIRSWFPHTQEVPYVLIRVRAEHAATWADTLNVPLRRSYITDQTLLQAAEIHNLPQAEVIATKLPDPGSTMAGDFGEFITYLYQGTSQHPSPALGATKWRLKQDRNQPAPHSDVIHLVLPHWPVPSGEDHLYCAEVKTKSTNGRSTPIASAIADSQRDRTSRLSRTLVWLRERAVTQHLGDITIDHLNRFINATQHPPAQKRFRAVAVVCASLVDAELASAPAEAHPDYTLIVISVPDLRDTYAQVFLAASAAEAAPPGQQP